MGGNVEKKTTKRKRRRMKGNIKEINSLEERKVLTCKVRQDLRIDVTSVSRRKQQKKRKKMSTVAAFILIKNTVNTVTL